MMAMEEEAVEARRRQTEEEARVVSWTEATAAARSPLEPLEAMEEEQEVLSESRWLEEAAGGGLVHGSGSEEVVENQQREAERQTCGSSFRFPGVSLPVLEAVEVQVLRQAERMVPVMPSAWTSRHGQTCQRLVGQAAH